VLDEKAAKWRQEATKTAVRNGGGSVDD
jgi:hypothetical protein